MRNLLVRRLVVAALVSCAWLTITNIPAEARRGAKYFTNNTVVAHDGKKFRFYDDLIKNRIVIINFIYTTCTDICGLQSARMALIQDRLGNRLGNDIYIYSISLDPEKDTVNALRDYATAFNPQPGWLFLTGESAKVGQIRYKLGERSRKLTEHQNYAVLGNGRTGEWRRTSMMKDIQLFVQEVFRMDPSYSSRDRIEPVKDTREFRRQYRQLASQTGQALFIKSCAACHNIGGGTRIGPDLAGVTERRDVGWLKQYIMRPTQMRANKDPIALALRRQYTNVLMPYLGLGVTDASDVLAYIRSQTLKWRKSSQAAKK